MDTIKNKLHFQRFEFKYHLSTDVAMAIRHFLSHKMVRDPYLEHSNSPYYWVTSLYFDSPTYYSFREKIDGAKARKKFRIRAYSNIFSSVDQYFLEIKRKYDMTVVKDRLAFPVCDLQRVMDQPLQLEQQRFSEKELQVWQEFLCARQLYRLKPQVQIRYKREPFIGKRDSKIRITFDYDLESLLFKHQQFGELEYIPVLDTKTVIMEVKFNNLLPGWFRDILYEYQLSREPYSKYCESVLRHNLVKI